MATGKSKSRSSAGGSGGFLKFFLGFVFAFVVVFGVGWAYLKFGNPPIAVLDKSLPFEADIVHTPLDARIEHEMQQPPFGISEDVYETGAMTYKLQCASCHGIPGKDVAFAKNMYPKAPQLWKKHSHGDVVGVSDDDAGETFGRSRTASASPVCLVQGRAQRGRDVGRRPAAQACERTTARSGHRHAQSTVAPGF